MDLISLTLLCVVIIQALFFVRYISARKKNTALDQVSTKESTKSKMEEALSCKQDTGIHGGTEALY